MTRIAACARTTSITSWAVGPSMSGEVHRGLSLAAVVSLPIAAILVGWAGRRSCWGRSSVLLGVVSLLAFAPIPIAYLVEPYSGVRWWRAIPLGLVERGLALSEVVTVLGLALWAAFADARRSGVEFAVSHSRV